jgi:MFS family permease
VFIAMYGVAGLGNTVYHPADYSLLSHHSPSEKLSQIFAFHTFAGMLGSAVAPVTLLAMQSHFGWRGAYIGAAMLGFVVLAVLIAQPEPAAALRPARTGKSAAPGAAVGWRMLMSPAILLNLAFFVLTSIMGNGLNTYLVVALGALHATPPAIANIALTSLLALNAIGVLAGGVLAGRVQRHALIAASGLTIAGAVTASIGLFDLPSTALIGLMGLSGFAVGATYPSRDMLVRAVTPPGAFGAVFGFVSTGFNIGASIAPIVYGMLMDHGQPRGVFLLSAAVSLICVTTVTFGFSQREAR